LACGYLPVGVTGTEDDAEPVTHYIHPHASLLHELISSDSEILSALVGQLCSHCD